MADMTLEEALAAATVDEELVTPVNEVLLINPETRTINVPDSEKLFGARQDMDVERKYFKCPRIVGDNIDLFEHRIFVNYVPSKRDGSYDAKEDVQSYWCKDLAVEGDFVTFSWKLSENVTRSAGYIAFAVYAKTIDEYGNLQTKWHTTIAIGNVLDTLPDGEEWTTVYPDIVMQLLERMDAVEKIANPKSMQEYVDDYFNRNPMMIDRELKDSTKAAPADIVGKLSEDIGDLKQNGIGTGGAITTVEPMEDDIPKVFIDGTIPTTKDDVLATMKYISKTDEFFAYIKIKCQGTSSMNYPKKNFTVKLYSDEARENEIKKAFKDWGIEESKFVLKANYIDHSHARNIVSARLWGEVVASRPDYDSMPVEMRNAPNNGAIDGFPIKVYYNGNYEGVYTWNIGKDDWMWGMDKDNQNHILLCAETNTSGSQMATPCNFRTLWSGIDETDWSVEVGTNSDAVKTALNNLIQFVMDNDGDVFRNGIGNYLDIQSAIDYYIFQYEICGLDGLGKNMLLATYDGVKWICGAYDMDSVFGLYWNGSTFVSSTFACPEHYEEDYSLLWERIEKNFLPELKARQAELRETVLSYSNMVTHFERFMDVIGSELYKEEYIIYPSIPSVANNNIKQIRNFIRDRQTYVDAQFASMGDETEPDVPDEPNVSDPSTQSTPLTMIGIYTADGFASNLTDWKTSEILLLPTNIAYDTITVKDATARTIVDVFDSEQTIVHEYVGQPAVCIVQDVQYYAVAKMDKTATSLEIEFTETYPGALKVVPYKDGLYNQDGFAEFNSGVWFCSDPIALPVDMTSGTIRFADDKSAGRIITTFDVDGNFIKENANISQIAFDGNVKSYAVAYNKNNGTWTGQNKNVALFVYVE